MTPLHLPNTNISFPDNFPIIPLHFLCVHNLHWVHSMAFLPPFSNWAFFWKLSYLFMPSRNFITPSTLRGGIPSVPNHNLPENKHSTYIECTCGQCTTLTLFEFIFEFSFKYALLWHTGKWFLHYFYSSHGLRIQFIFNWVQVLEGQVNSIQCCRTMDG